MSLSPETVGVTVDPDVQAAEDKLAQREAAVKMRELAIRENDVILREKAADGKEAAVQKAGEGAGETTKGEGKAELELSAQEEAWEGTFMEVLVVFGSCLALAALSVTFFIVVCVLPLSAGTWYFDDPATLRSKVDDWLPPSAVDAGMVDRVMAPNVTMAILLQTIVQLFANPFYIIMQMRALCGFWGFTDPFVMVPNIAYSLWIIIAPLCLQEYFWYYWIDFTVGLFFLFVEAAYSYRMIGATATDVGTIATGNDIVPFADRPADMKGRVSPAAAIFFSSSWVIGAVYVVVPMTIAGWMGLTTPYATGDLGTKLSIILGMQIMFMIAIPIVRIFLNRFSPLGATADMLILMHPQIHKSISSRMLVASLSSTEELVVTCFVLSGSEVVSRAGVYPLTMWLKKNQEGGDGKISGTEKSNLYILSRLVDQLLEILCIVGCPLCMYIFQKETIIFTFAGEVTFSTLCLQIFIQMAFEVATDVFCLSVEVFSLKFKMLRVFSNFKKNLAYVRFLAYSVLTMGLLYFIYISTKFPRYPCPDPDWCACNGNMETCFVEGPNVTKDR